MSVEFHGDHKSVTKRRQIWPPSVLGDNTGFKNSGVALSGGHQIISLSKTIYALSSPWFESIRYELFIAKRERCQVERKWRNTKLTIFKDLYRQAKHKVSKLVHTDKF